MAFCDYHLIKKQGLVDNISNLKLYLRSITHLYVEDGILIASFRGEGKHIQQFSSYTRICYSEYRRLFFGFVFTFR